MTSTPAESQRDPPPSFANTRWSLVAALNSGDDRARRSLEELCRSYWYPVYAYTRRCGHPPQMANDISQAYFGALLQEIQRNDPAAAGRFRDFLLASLNRFLSADWRARLGEGATLAAPCTVADLETRLARDHQPEITPEHAFQKSYALEVLSRSLQRLHVEARQGGRIDMFEALLPYLTTDPAAGQYALLAEGLGTRPLALVVAVRRLRQRYRELVDQELIETVATPADLERERRALFAMLSGARKE